MPLLIDCYNVLHQTMPPSLAGLDERGLCFALARSRWARQHAIVVVDGTVKPHSPATSPVENVHLLYAGRGNSADAAIIQLIAADSAPRRLLVVSSDREIQKAARRRRARVMGSDHFVRDLSRIVSAPGGKPRRGGPRAATGRPDIVDPLPPGEVQRWLERFGLTDDD